VGVGGLTEIRTVIVHCANHDIVVDSSSFSYINILYPDVGGKQT